METTTAIPKTCLQLPVLAVTAAPAKAPANEVLTYNKYKTGPVKPSYSFRLSVVSNRYKILEKLRSSSISDMR